MSGSRWVRAVTIALVAGCGAGTRIPIDDYVALQASATCAKIFACCTYPEIVQRYPYYGPQFDESMCAALFASRAAAELQGTVKPAIAGGDIAYDGVDANDCVDAIDAQACIEFAKGAPPDCTNPLSGKVDVGGPCTLDAACTTGFCEGLTIGVRATCQPFPTTNEACPDERCAQGRYCDQQGTCRDAKGDRSPCDTAAECASGGCIDPAPGTGVGVCGAPNTCDGL